MNSTFTLPGTTEPAITLRQPWTGRAELLVGGQPVPRTGGFRPTYHVPMSDGTTKEVRLRGSFFGLKGEVDGQAFDIERPLQPLEWILVLAPFLLAGFGGIVGGGFGALAAIANVRTLRSSRPPAVRAGLAILNIAIAFLAWYLIASFLVSRLG